MFQLYHHMKSAQQLCDKYSERNYMPGHLLMSPMSKSATANMTSRHKVTYDIIHHIVLYVFYYLFGSAL